MNNGGYIRSILISRRQNRFVRISMQSFSRDSKICELSVLCFAAENLTRIVSMAFKSLIRRGQLRTPSVNDKYRETASTDLRTMVAFSNIAATSPHHMENDEYNGSTNII